jgi:DNA polymerase alpha subunit A
VRGRLAKDDFVVDDGIGGYMDNGMDDFDESDKYAESDEEDRKPCKHYSV